MSLGVESLPWLQRQKGWVWGVNIGTEMDLMCHVIATRVRSSGFWWASRWSALPSHVRSAIPFGSRVTFFVKSFSIVCWQNCAPGSPTTFTPVLPPPWGKKAFPVTLKSPDTSWSGIGGKSMRHKLPWSLYELGQLFLAKTFFSLTLASCPTYVFSCTCVNFFGGRAQTPMCQGALLIRPDTTPEASYATLD